MRQELIVLFYNFCKTIVIGAIGAAIFIMASGKATSDDIASVGFLSALFWFVGSIFTFFNIDDEINGFLSAMFNTVGAFYSGAAVLMTTNQNLMDALRHIFHQSAR